LKRVINYETEMTAHHLDDIGRDLGIAASYGKALGMPPEETITEDKVDVMVSRRMLPSRDAMERGMRYESHLHRHWVQTHHELEAIQSNRRGQRVSSLTRIDVAASPGLGA